jgi:DNA-binding response OmpR family regulator
MEKKTILLVEDDYALAMGTVFVLESEGYEVRHASNLKNARQLLDDKVNLIILDVMLPDGSGYEFCENVRAEGVRIPIIFLTAMSEEINIVQGLEMGADDYVAKPYRLKELLSRIAANLRRYDMMNKGVKQEYTFGHHRFLQKEFRLYDGDRLVDCTQSELRLLSDLVANEGVVMTRSAMLDKLYDIDGVLIDDNTLSVYMKRLRAKLGDDAGHIETVRGVGYRFNREG